MTCAFGRLSLSLHWLRMSPFADGSQIHFFHIDGWMAKRMDTEKGEDDCFFAFIFVDFYVNVN